MITGDIVFRCPPDALMHRGGRIGKAVKIRCGAAAVIGEIDEHLPPGSTGKAFAIITSREPEDLPEPSTPRYLGTR